MPEYALTSTQPSGLTIPQFSELAEVPAALTWFANIDNPQTRRA